MSDMAMVDQLDAADMVAGLTACFRDQVQTWRAAGRIAIPLLVLADAAPARRGSCISCGGLAPVGWRCAACVAAVNQVLELEPPTSRGLTRRPLGHVVEAEAPRPWWDD